MKHLGIAFLLTSALTQPVSAQTDTAIAVQAAEATASKWLALVDGGRYDASWDSAAGVFRSAVSRTDWRVAVSHARSQFEPFGARRLLGARFTLSLPDAPPGEYVVLVYETRVSGDRAVIETVTPTKEPDGRWRVSGYFVRTK